MKEYKVVWTTQATCDLEEIVDYIAADNLNAAVKVFQKIKTRCAKLKVSPKRNRIAPELKEIGIINYREMIIQPYRILYKLNQNKVSVFAIVDSRRDMESFLFNRLIR